MQSNRLYWCAALLAGLALACNMGAQAPLPTPNPSTGNPTATTADSAPAVTTPAPDAETPTPSASATASAPADAIVVDTFDQEVYPFKENGNCSLGEAIWAVLTQKQVDGCAIPPGSTTIYLLPGTYPLTDTDNSAIPIPGNASPDRLGLDPAAFPVIFAKVTILGNGSTLQRSGPKKFTIFQTFVRGDLTLSDLTITGGDTTGGEYSNADGGALQLTGGQATLKHVTLTGNRANYGGAIVNEGATVTIEDSSIQANTATGQGGGISNSAGTLILKNSTVAGNIAQSTVFGGGGIYNESGQLTLDHSRIEGNRAEEGGGIYNDGGTLAVTNGSVIAANLAAETDADIPHGGGGINSIGEDAQVTVSDSFILGNRAEKSVGGGIYNQAALTVTHSVLAYNMAGGGGALLNDDLGTGSISQSCILQNKAVAVTNGLGSGIESASEKPFDAGNNWWGAADGPGPFGPGSGDSVTHNVSFDDFLKVPVDICAAEIPTPAVTPVTP